MSVLGQLVRTFGVLSLLSVGGANATVPEIHRQVVSILHWMDDATFAKLIAIGQTAPGPNVLIVGMIGWQVDGLVGMVAATIAMILPAALLAWAIGRVMARYASVEWIGLVRRALTPIAVGFMLASGIVMTRASYTGAASLAIVASVAAMVYLTRASPIWGILAGAACGITGYVFLGMGP